VTTPTTKDRWLPRSFNRNTIVLVSLVMFLVAWPCVLDFAPFDASVEAQSAFAALPVHAIDANVEHFIYTTITVQNPLYSVVLHL
jgi:hypothetical protein